MHETGKSLRFGFLHDATELSAPGYCISPLDDHEARREWLVKSSNEDGFLYPPQVSAFRYSLDRKSRKKVPRTSRPAQTFHLPASHVLRVHAPIESELPCSDATFLVQVLAYLNGTRLQFEDWRFDTRIPVNSVLGAVVPHGVQSDFLSHAYDWWKSMVAASRARALNVFYAFNRANGSEWEWDLFMQQYMVFDGIYRLHVERGGDTAKNHRDRFNVLISAYGVPTNKDLVDCLYRARNDLFHEGIWAGAMMGYAERVPDAIHFPRHMRRLNARLMCAITGYRNGFSSSIWWAMGSFLFDKPNVAS